MYRMISVPSDGFHLICESVCDKLLLYVMFASDVGGAITWAVWGHYVSVTAPPARQSDSHVANIFMLCEGSVDA